MMALDAAKRDVCRVKRERTSSPLQALAMLNGPQFVEAGRALSQRLLDQHGDDADAITNDMFRILTSRQPSKQERKVIQTLYATQRDYFLGNSQAAQEYLSNGQYGDYGTAPVALSLPANEHDFRLGFAPNGQEKFAGEFGRASIFAQPLSELSVKALAALPQQKEVVGDVKPVVSRSLPFSAGPEVFDETAKLEFVEGLTLECWVKPVASGTGRLWDKITPGQGDGLLLDLHGGLRFICGDTAVMADRAPVAGQWTHVACTVNFKSGQVRFFLNGESAGGRVSNPNTYAKGSLASIAAWASVANTLINHDECVTKR
jgi:hypothetical protein